MRNIDYCFNVMLAEGDRRLFFRYIRRSVFMDGAAGVIPKSSDSSKGQVDKLYPVFRMQPSFCFYNVVPDGSRRDLQDVCDFAVGQSPCQIVQNLFLPSGQLRECFSLFLYCKLAHIFIAASFFRRRTGRGFPRFCCKGDVQVAEADAVSFCMEKKSDAGLFTEDEAAARGGAETAAAADQCVILPERSESPDILLYRERRQFVLPALQICRIAFLRREKGNIPPGLHRSM